jgi:outer membrane protein assembly factor BamA
VNRFAVKALAAAMLCAMLTPLGWAGQADPLVVEDLRCRGNAATACEFILGHVYLGRGDALDETELQNAQLRLSTLRTFESVKIYLEKGSERGRAIVVIEVVEADPIATEWMLGASYRLGAFRSVTAGRLLHQNLFGAGKLADLSIVAVTPLNGPSEERYAASLRYADPHLFGSKRYFAIAGMSYVDAEFGDSRYDNFNDTDVFRFGATLGRRLWDFSYLMVGYAYRARNDQLNGHWDDDGNFVIERERNRHVIDFVYGWNSEDDLYFPTRGSSFHIGGGWDFGTVDDSDDFYLQFRKTWRAGDGYASVLLSGYPSHEYRQTFHEGQLLAASYAHPIAPSSSIRRGRWYVEAGYSTAGYDSVGSSIREHALKLGLRLDTESLGLIDLYLLGTWDPK